MTSCQTSKKSIYWQVTMTLFSKIETLTLLHIHVFPYFGFEM